MAVIGVYTGREDNIFWRRVPGAAGGRIEAAGARSLGERDAEPLGRDIIHSVTNPLSRLTGAIHVYGGDFFAVAAANGTRKRCRERAYDMEKRCGCSRRPTRGRHERQGLCLHLRLPDGRSRPPDGRRRGPVRLPIPAYLIEHPKGTALFDTGMHPDCQHDPAGRVGARLAGLFAFDYHPGEEIAPACKRSTATRRST